MTGDELHAHVKFQIIQYASIYEAVICYLLWNNFKDHQRVKDIEMHMAYKPVSALAQPTQISYEGEPAFICLYKSTRTLISSIKFDDKVDAAVDIGFIEDCYADEIKGFYKLRNYVHIETASKKQVQYEIEQSKLAYRRMEPFINNIKEFLAR